VCITVKDLVESSVSDSLEWPHRIVLPVGDTPANIIRWFFLRSLLSLKIVNYYALSVWAS
jgi:hypothetical protein